MRRIVIFLWGCYGYYNFFSVPHRMLWKLAGCSQAGACGGTCPCPTEPKSLRRRWQKVPWGSYMLLRGEGSFPPYPAFQVSRASSGWFEQVLTDLLTCPSEQPGRHRKSHVTWRGLAALFQEDRDDWWVCLWALKRYLGCCTWRNHIQGFRIVFN